MIDLYRGFIMCGRYEIDIQDPLMREVYDFLERQSSDDVVRPKFGEIFPTNMVPILTESRAETSSGASGPIPRVAAKPTVMTWGFTGFRSSSHTIINARGETVTEKSMFSTSFEERRCIIPATGFYEWSGQKGSRIRHELRSEENGLIYMAGLWRPEQDSQRFVIITRASVGEIESIHDRMPILVPRADVDGYLTDLELASSWLVREPLLPRFVDGPPKLQEQSRLDL